VVTKGAVDEWTGKKKEGVLCTRMKGR
jgi:hypothetical protein